MKIITLGDKHYVPFIINSYRNLKLIDKQDHLTVLCTCEEAVNSIKQIEPNCDAIHYTRPEITLPDQSNYWVYNGLLQYLKILGMKEYTKKYGKIFYLDSDVAIFGDFISKIEILLDNYSFAFKLYQQKDRFCSNNYRTLINSGTVGIKDTKDSDKFFEYFEKVIVDKPTPTMNLEEYIMTDFKDTHTVNNCIIDDTLNLVNSENRIYTKEEVIESNTLSFHPTFCTIPGSKQQFIASLNKWFYE